MAFVRSSPTISANTTNGSTSLTNVNSTLQIFVGMNVYGTGIQADTIVTGISGAGPNATVTISRAATANGTGVGISGQYITQSGTDTDPTGLAAMTGVTTIDTGTGNSRRTIYNLGQNQLRIQGTFTHDPDLFEITTPLQQGFIVQAGAVYNYGIARTVNSQTTYSKGTGLSSTYPGGQFTNFGVHFEGGTVNWNGGVIKTCSSILTSAASVISNSYDSVWQMWNGGDTQWRAISAAPTFNAITMQGITHQILLFMNAGWNALGVKFERCAFQTPAGGGPNRTILNPVFLGNQSLTDIITNQTVNPQQIITVKNPDRFPVYGKLSNNAYADMPTVQALTLSVTDANNVAVGASDVVSYIKDSNNGARLNSTVTNYVNDRTYIASSTSGGVINMGDILTLAGVNLNLTTGVINNDFRSNFGNNSADFNISIGGYNYLPAVTRQTLMGNNGKSVTWTMFTDTNVTLSRTAALALIGTKFTIDPVARTVTAIANATLDELYDATKAYKYSGTIAAFEAAAKDSLIVSGVGQNLTGFTGWSFIVNNGVTVSSGTKFNYVFFPTVTLNGTGLITAVYASNAGTSTVWQFQNVAVGSSLVIYNNAGTTLYFRQEVTTAGTYAYYIPPGVTGTYTWAVERYGFQRQSGTFAANTGGLLFYVPIYVEDVGISQTNKATVAAYTSLETASKFFDYTAYFRLGEQGIKLGQIAARSGTAIEIGNFSHLINKDAAAVYSITGTTITTKSTSYAGDSRYTTEIANPPRTITANTNEVITIAIEDANGNSQLSIDGGDGTFQLWKVTTSTPTADYATGTLLATVGNGIYRFIGVTGFDIVGVDTNSNIRRRTSMAKGVYTQAFYVGSQIQLAQAPEVTEILTKVNILQVSVDDLPSDILASPVETGATVVESLRLHNSVLGGKVSGGGSGVETFRDLADTKDRLVSTNTATGDRTAEVYDLT